MLLEQLEGKGETVKKNDREEKEPGGLAASGGGWEAPSRQRYQKSGAPASSTTDRV